MPENPLEKIFNEIQEILKYTQSENPKLKNAAVPKELFEKLNQLKQQVLLFSEAANQFILSTGIDPDTIASNKIKSLEMLPPFQNLIKKALLIKKQAEAQRQMLILQQEHLKNSSKTKKEKNEDKKQSIIKRQKKFKSMGGSNWMPL